MKHFSTCLLLTCSYFLQSYAQVNTRSDDKNWSAQSVALASTPEADFIIRLGDVDNLGFGWPEGFDPFCSRTTDVHGYPWDARAEDLPGFDRILLSSKYKPDDPRGCGADGYSGSYDKVQSRPVIYRLPLSTLKGAAISNAYLQIFIDDFQSPSLCSKFRITINGKRFAEAEKLLNVIDQTGPVGKLLSIPMPEEFYPELSSTGELAVYIDEVNGSADGFAIDFIRLLVNRKMENACRGSIRGVVVDKETQLPLKGASVFMTDKRTIVTAEDGRFEFSDIPTGYEVFSANLTGYNEGAVAGDIGQGDDNPEVVISLEKGKQPARFGNRDIRAGESISLNNILFNLGKAELKAESFPELDKVVAFMQANPSAEIELSGHTSSEGEAAMNRSLSYRRVRSCKEYLVAKGIDPGRVIAVGYGPDRPVAPNDSEPNRAKNRRVEMRVTKM